MSLRQVAGVPWEDAQVRGTPEGPTAQHQEEAKKTPSASRWITRMQAADGLTSFFVASPGVLQSRRARNRNRNNSMQQCGQHMIIIITIFFSLIPATWCELPLLYQHHALSPSFSLHARSFETRPAVAPQAALHPTTAQKDGLRRCSWWIWCIMRCLLRGNHIGRRAALLPPIS